MDQIKSYSNLDSVTFDNLVDKDFPFIICGADFGECLTKWNINYLSTKLNDYQIKIHVSDHPNLSFLNKNFKYESCLFGSFLEECANGPRYVYLRSTGNDKRGRNIADIKEHFPAIKDDISYPKFVNCCDKTTCIDGECTNRHIFSSVFRVSSKELVVWTHYDMLDNILLQVKGRKKVILFSPNDAPFLYLNGDKSEIADFDQSDIDEKYTLFKNATKYECILNEGDAIFIPSLWFHSTKALDFSIGINFFWKDNNLDHLYNKTDVYGNKDLIPATDAYSNIDKAVKHLSKLPDKYKQFYLNMIILKLNKELK